MSEQVTGNVQGTDSKKKKKGLLVLVLAIALVGAIAFTLLATGGVVVSGEARSLARELKKDGTTTIVLDKDVEIKTPLVVNGKKTITGSGKIVLSEKAKIEWPELEEIKSFGGVGCATVKIHDTSIMPAMFVVSSDAELTIAGNVGVDAVNFANVCQVQSNGSFTLKDKASLENGRYCNVDVQEKAEFTLKGGKSLNGTKFNVISKGTTEVDGGTVSGTVEKSGAAIYSTSKLVIKDGLVEKSACHNIYVAKGEFEMTGGASSFSKADGIIVKQEATATITGGTMELHTKHGIHNDGKMTIGKATLIESGILNGPKGVMDLDGAHVKGSYAIALSNEGGDVVAKNFTTKNCEATAICNLSGKMDLKDINLDGGRDGNISIIDGEVTIENAILDKCREKSVSISGGKVNIKNIDVQGTSGKFNGVYVLGGELYMEDATISNTGDCGFRVDQAGWAEVKNVTIKDTTSTAIFGGRGTIVMDGVTAENIGGHGVYNTGGKVTISNFKIKKVRNVIQQRKGETIINNITADEMELGAYCQEGLLSINGGKFTNSASNGLRVKEKTTGGLPTLELKNVTISDVAFHGISNMGIFKGENVTIKNTGMNGFYNKETAKATVKGLKVSNVTAYGISNGLKANLNMSNVTVEKVGLNGKNNAVHNLGTVVVDGLKINGNQRNGIYNVGKMTGKDITVSDIKENGIYNNTDAAKTGFKGQFNVTNVTVHDTGSQGVTNMREATLKVKNLVVYNVPENGLRNHNSGIADVDGGKIYNVDKHGINNDSSTLTLNNFEIYDVNRAGRDFNLLNNSGKLTGTNVNLHGKAFRALYTNLKGTVSITGLKADGSELLTVSKNSKGETVYSRCVVDNHAGDMILKDSSIINAKEKALYALRYQNEKGETIRVSNTILNNVKIENAGTHGIEMQDECTMQITGVEIKNVTGVAIYNMANMTSKNLTIDNCKNGVSCRNNGSMTLSGKIAISNIGDTGLQTWGDEEKGNNNQISIAKGAKVLIDTTGGHGVVNRGTLKVLDGASFTVQNVAKDKKGIYNYNHYSDTLPTMTVNKGATISIANVEGDGIMNRGTLTMNQDATLDMKNISGVAVNAIHNYTDGTITLGKVNVSGIDVESNASVQGNAIANRGNMTLLGDVTVSNIHGSGANINSNRNYAGITQFTGEIKGNANVTVIGDLSDESGRANATTASFGVYVEEGNVTLGNVKIYNVRQRGIHVGNENKAATLKAKSIIVDNVRDRGIFMQNTKCVIDVAENVTVNNTLNQGFYANGKATVGKDLVISNVTINGSNGANGLNVRGNSELTIDGNLTVNGVSGKATGDFHGNGVLVAEAATMLVKGDTTIKNIATTATNDGEKVSKLSGNALATDGKATFEGDVTIDSVTQGHGIVSQKGSLTINKLVVTNTVAREAVLLSESAEVEVKAGAISGAYATSGGDKKPFGIITLDGENAKLTLKDTEITGTGTCKYAIVTVGAVTAENVTLDGCGMKVADDSCTLTLKGNVNIKNYKKNGIEIVTKGKLILEENTVLDISRIAETECEAAIQLTDQAEIHGEKATVNISGAKGSNGHGIYIVASRNLKPIIKIGNMSIEKCEGCAIKISKEIEEIKPAEETHMKSNVRISLLKVTNCGAENKIELPTDCYVLAP